MIKDTIDKVLKELNVNNLSDDDKFEDLDKMEEGIALIVAKIPAINFKIEEAINNEIAHIKESKAIIDR